jgi:hypothetical protein
MLIQILKGTPAWVFVLFAGLVVIGVMQSRARSVSAGRLMVLPAAFIAFSLFGVIAAFGAQPALLVAWALGVGVAVLVRRVVGSPSNARWDPASTTFQVPGSWTPLALMMTVFFARYAISVSLAMQPALAKEALFAIGVSLGYGLLSGAFLARALHVLAVRSPIPVHSVQST